MYRGRRGAKGPEGPGLRLPALEPRGGGGGLASVIPPVRWRRGGDQGHAGRDEGPAPRGSTLGNQDLRLDLQEPRRRRASGWADGGPATRGGRVSWASGRRRALLTQARELRGE